MLKQQNFFYSQPSTLPKEALAKFYLPCAFGLSFMISSVVPTRSSTFYAYLVTKIGNRNSKSIRQESRCFQHQCTAADVQSVYRSRFES